ncbi:MAG TPA: TOBE domain-containing protein [Burkholderiaceae bacterium]|nr:TOBE domain-containing protein [Burkholderiaceae bacterium]
MNEPLRSPRLTGRLEMTSGPAPFLGDTRVRLLEEIDRHGSILQAARHVPMSYKTAWEAVEAMNNLAEQPLVDRITGGRSGGGTTLTAHGRRLVALYRAMQAEYQSTLERLAERFADEPEGDVRAFQRLLRRLAVRSSARNQLAGTVLSLRDGPVDVDVSVGIVPGLRIDARITHASVERLGLRVGSEVIAMIKASGLRLERAGTPSTAADVNRFRGELTQIVEGPESAEVTVTLGDGRCVTAVCAVSRLHELTVGIGDPVGVGFEPSAVILVVVD